MISDHNLGALMGAPVSGPGDEKIGTVGQVFIDPDTGKPNWVTVHTGLFGRHESFVPVDDAEWDREVLHVPFSKDVVKDAPRIETDQALSPDDEVSLYRYYGMPVDDVDSGDVAVGRDVDTDRETDQGNTRPDDFDSNDGGGNTQPLGAAPLAHTDREEPAGEKPIGERLAEATRRFVDKQKSGHDGHDDTQTDRTDQADTIDRDESVEAEPGSDAGSGRARMRRYVIVEEEVPADSDTGLTDGPREPRQP